MDLLDLQQKEGSLDLARLAKEQADETEAQSKILMLFTIVTIVFVRHFHSLVSVQANKLHSFHYPSSHPTTE